jgi:uncharacterized tellurite resistance protein B-like protein
MLRVFKDLFDAVLAAPGEAAPAERAAHLRLAAAVLLVEVMRADGTGGPAERLAVVRSLRAAFGLGQEQTLQLVALAEETSRAANDFFQFTSALNDGFTQDEKVRIVEALWRVAYADGALQAEEQHVVWRLADLLHVPHGEYIAAKMRAKQEGR